jgi:hypothetical protein
MKYMLLIQYGDTPVPPSEEWNRLSQDEQKAVFAGYQAVNETPGVTPASGCSIRVRQRPCGCRTATR